MTDYQSLSLGGLVNLAQKGDYPAFTELYYRHEKPLYNFIKKFIRNEDQSADIFQETFTSAYEHLDQLHSPDFFKTWLFEIALNKIRKTKKSERKRPKSLEQLTTDKEGEVFEHLAVAVERSGNGGSDRTEKYLQLHESILKLPQKYQEVIVLYYFALKGLPERQRLDKIVKILQPDAINPRGLINKWLFRAKLKLKKLLEREQKRG